MKRVKIIAIEALIASVFLLLSHFAVLPANAQNEPAQMWITPEIIDETAAVNGSRFNVTISLNVSTPSYAWQFYLVYNRTYIQALRGDYTGAGKSQWAGDSITSPGELTIDDRMSGHPPNLVYVHSYVTLAETLQGTETRTGNGSLAWIEFIVRRVPLTEATWLSLNISGTFNSQVLNSSFGEIRTLYSYATVLPEFTLPVLMMALFTMTCCFALVSRRFRRKTGLQQE
jgi:hypothetical protein